MVRVIILQIRIADVIRMNRYTNGLSKYSTDKKCLCDRIN